MVQDRNIPPQQPAAVVYLPLHFRICLVATTCSGSLVSLGGATYLLWLVRNLIGTTSTLEQFVVVLLLILAIYVLCIGCFVFTMGLDALQTHLLLNAEGVTYQTVWYQVATPWTNVEQLGTITHGFVPVQGLLLRQPVAPTGWLRGYALLLGVHRVIPLSRFGPWWGESELAHALRQFAPHLRPGTAGGTG